MTAEAAADLLATPQTKVVRVGSLSIHWFDNESGSILIQGPNGEFVKLG